MAIKLHMHVETKIEGRWEHYTALEIPNTGELENKYCLRLSITLW